MSDFLRPRWSCQQGFSLIEISVVAAILLIVAVIGVPAIQGYVVESRVPKLAEALQRFVYAPESLAREHRRRMQGWKHPYWPRRYASPG